MGKIKSSFIPTHCPIFFLWPLRIYTIFPITIWVGVGSSPEGWGSSCDGFPQIHFLVSGGKELFFFFFNCITSYCLSYKIVLTSNFLKLKPRIRYLIPRRGQARKRLVKCSSEKGGRVERGVRSVTDCEQSIEITHYLRTSRKACSPPAVLKAQVFIHFYLTVIFQLAFIKYNICNMNNMHPLTRPSGPIYKK